MLQIHTIFGRIRRMLRIRIGFLIICWYLLPEGAEPLPYSHAGNLYGFPRHCTMLEVCTGQHSKDAAPDSLALSFQFILSNTHG